MSRAASPRRRASPEPTEPGVPRVLLQPRPFILTGLPYKRDDTLREVTRTARTGRHAYLTITYIATDQRYPLPYGADRGLLAWITTKALDDGWVTFTAVTEYFRAFGLNSSGRSYRLFRERFQRVANLALRIEETDSHQRSILRLFLVPQSIEPLELAYGSVHALPARLLTYCRYGFRLDDGFWSYLRQTRIPTPLQVLRTFHDSPRSWDFAQLLLYRSFAAASRSVLPWPDLLVQLGTQDRDHYRLKYRLEQTLATLRDLYPDCPARFLPGLQGLQIAPWRPG